MPPDAAARALGAGNTFRHVACPRPSMKSPSTADSREPSGLPVDSATDPTLARRSSTHANVKGETAPRLPHERDESSDSGTAAPDPLMRQAAEDIESGKRPTDRSEATDALYGRTLRGGRGDAGAGAAEEKPQPGDGAGAKRR
jgi:hypothetical protein